MPTITLSNDQVVELVKQLPQEYQQEVFRFLLLQQWDQWEALSNYGADQVRLVAWERNQDWDRMTEEERENFVNAIVQEG